MKNELSKFWDWAQITFNEYASNVIPSAARQAEWEGEYPGWPRLESEVKSLILQLNKSKEFDSDAVQDVLTVLAIDNESEGILESIQSSVSNNELINKLIEETRNFKSYHARWQIVELIKESAIPDKASKLKWFALNDSDKYVQRRALMALWDVDNVSAKLIAEIKSTDDDDYLRRLALEILQNGAK